jgi:SAM-dependent methyltransferase
VNPDPAPRWFDHPERARRYEQTRPQVHDQVVRELLELRGGDRAPEFALDLACGTGHLTRALAGRVGRVLGLDVSTSMLSAAPPDVRGVVACARAEAVPLADGACDLVTVSMGFHWLDEDAFLREALRVLTPGGELWILNFWFPGVMLDSADYAAWSRDRYATRFPAPRRGSTRPADALDEHPGFTWHGATTFEFEVEFSRDSLREYLTSQSNIEVALVSGATLDEVDTWLDAELGAFIPSGETRAFRYEGRADRARAR